jgi:hypothetical protein
MAIVVALLAGACTPTTFRVAPYRDDPAAAATLAQQAADLCATRRGPERLPPHPFTSDGCSMGPDGTWVDCCIEHDMAYWCGGSVAERREADRALCECMDRRKRSPVLGAMAWATTRIGGAPWLPAPWRWGYGWGDIGRHGRHGSDNASCRRPEPEPNSAESH